MQSRRHGLHNLCQSSETSDLLVNAAISVHVLVAEPWVFNRVISLIRVCHSVQHLGGSLLCRRLPQGTAKEKS